MTEPRCKNYSLRNEKIKLVNATATSLNEHMTELFENGYEQGYADGKAEVENLSEKITYKDIDEAYNKGLNDAWEVIQKITRDDSVGGYSIEMMQTLFGQTYVYDIVHNYEPREAIAKIKEYEDKQKQAEIKVGDEVRLIGSNPHTDDCDYGICTKTNHETMYVMRKDGSVGEENKAEWIKTNRTFPQIAEVLAELRGTENDE